MSNDQALYQLLLSRPKAGRRFHVSLEANIGTGKSTLIDVLKTRMKEDVFVLSEPVALWGNWLDKCYGAERVGGAGSKNPYACSFQIKVLLAYADVFRSPEVLASRGVIMERSPMAAVRIFTETNEALGVLDEDEGDLIRHLTRSLFPTNGGVPECVLYLSVPDAAVSMSRIATRARDVEEGISPSLVAALHEAHEKLFHDDATSDLVEQTDRFQRRILKGGSTVVYVLDATRSPEEVARDSEAALSSWLSTGD